jgi:hypothetical protein
MVVSPSLLISIPVQRCGRILSEDMRFRTPDRCDMYAGGRSTYSVYKERICGHEMRGW